MIEHTASDRAAPILGFEADLELLAAQQGVSLVTDFNDLLGDFWPEDESPDDFIAAVREWRREGDTGTAS